MPRVLYASFMLAALVVFLLARRLIPRPPELLVLPWWKRASLAAAAFIGGVLGGKAPFAAAHQEGWFSYAAWFSDGKTIVAGLIGAYLAVELTKRLLGIRVKTGDTFALPLALAMAVGRWGCFFNGCCYGVETTLPWGVWFRVPIEDGVRWMKCHPTQIYESLFHSTMALVIWQLMRRGLLPDQRLKLYLLAYGVYRFLTEYIRSEPAWCLGLTFYQWAAAALAMGMILQWLADRRRDAVRIDAVA
jgi:prolipoprotein diacylglyceryltransferase